MTLCASDRSVPAPRRMAGAREWLTSTHHGSSVILPSRTTTPKCRRCLTASKTSRIMLRYSSTGSTPATLSHTKKSWPRLPGN
jgi:hypothetical protein